tara:strand:- start:286 stop:504 length:219 start_codon:yes stop_codon:yes gene_type:complete
VITRNKAVIGAFVVGVVGIIMGGIIGAGAVAAKNIGLPYSLPQLVIFILIAILGTLYLSFHFIKEGAVEPLD